MKLRVVGQAGLQASIGALLSLVVTQWKPEAAREWSLYVATLLILLLLFGIALYADRIYSAVATAQPTVKVYSADSANRERIYLAMRSAVTSARESIVAVTYNDNVPDPESTGGARYYDELEHKIRDSQNSQRSFSYTRIYQVHDPAVPLSEALLGKRSFAHLQELGPLRADNPLSGVKVFLQKTRVRVLLSMAIVDGTSAFVGLLQETPRGILLVTQIEIHDKTGGLVEPFVEICKRLEADSVAALA